MSTGPTGFAIEPKIVSLQCDIPAEIPARNPAVMPTTDDSGIDLIVLREIDDGLFQVARVTSEYAFVTDRT